MLEQEGRLFEQQLSDAHKAKEHATSAHNKTQEVHQAYTHKAQTAHTAHANTIRVLQCVECAPRCFSPWTSA